MADSVGFHEIIPHLTSSSTFKNVNINTGASQSTLQDIKIPDYGGGYVYQGTSPVTHNRYIFWRVSDDTVEVWEESLDRDLTHNRVLLRIVGLPVLEGVSVHERDGKHVLLLVATIASTHCFTLPHPDTLQQAGDGISCSSIFNELEQHNLREVHSMHLMATPAVEGGRAPPTSSGLVGSSAVFLFGQPSAALLLLCMDTVPSTTLAITAGVPGSSGASSNSTATVSLIKNTSLVNRLFMGFVPGMFRGGEGSDTINSLCCVALSPSIVSGTKISTNTSSSQVFGVGVCGDGRLRLWCLRRKECVLIRDTLEDTAEAATRHTPHGQRHVLSCRSGGEGSVAVIAVLLSFVEKQLLLLYKVTAAAAVGGTSTAGAGSSAPPPPPTLTHIKTLYPPQHHLVDMDLTPTHVWTLWTDANNENQLLYCSIDGGPGLGNAILQPPPEKSVPHADTSLDPRELCLQELFAPYQFAPHTIAKALSIYRGGASSKDENNPIGLREEVEAVLQGQLDAKTSQHTTSPDQLYDLTLDTWQNFYSHALQYHQVGMKGLGVVCGGGGGAVALVRRKAVSWLAEADGLETMVAAALVASPAQDLAQVVVRCGTASVLCGDSAAAASVAGVLRCVAVVRGLMDADVAAAFLLDMAHHSHPEAVAEDVAASLLGQVIGGDEVASIVSNAVCSVPNFPGGLRLLVRALNLDSSSAAVAISAEGSGGDGPRCQLWCALVAGSLHQLASSRLLLCRDLLVLQQLALQLAQLCHLSPDSVGQLRASLLQDTVLVSRAYHALLCLARAPATRPTARHLHATRRLVAALGLQDSTTLLPPLPQGTLPATALQAVLQQGACSELGAGLARGKRDSMKLVSKPGVWVTAALEAVRAITRLAWPLQDRGGSTALLEALVFSGQGEAALHYIRQVCGWCEWSLYSRHFLLGVCLLLQGQYRKAARLLQEAGEGCATEQLLAERVGGGEGAEGETGGRVHYTLRLVRLFEVFGQPALALRLAAGSLCLAQHSPHHLAQLYAVLFKHHLALGHHDEAFTALLANPDSGPQRACLRQLLVALYQRGCLSTLVNYQYGNLTGEVVTILENRARSADILVNNYYHLLYAFHVHKQNYKKAASVMYECAWRLSAEGVGEEGLKQQLKCYLACINCLKLLPKDAAWILKPNPVLPSGETENRGGKRCSAGERVSRSSSKCRRRGGAVVQVLELQHINKEYQLVHALLTLAAASPGTHCSTGLANDASSTIALLCHGRLYREASRLCRLFDVSEGPVVQSLAAACVLADSSSDRQQHMAWLKHNGVSNTTSGWWDLLRELVCAEPGKSSDLHRTVTTSLLDRGHQLPPWLLDSYTRRDPGGLLRVLLLYGRLEDAGQLALRLLDAVTAGINADQFGLTGAVHSSGDRVWLPYTALDHLLLELRENKHHQYYDKVLTILEGKLRRYQSELARVSRDAVLMAQR